MTFTQIADTRENVTIALLNIDMIRHFAKSSAEGKVDIGKILDYCDFAAQPLEEARERLQTEINNILKEEGYK